MKQYIIVALLAVLSFSSCGSNDPVWADLEAHEKTEQLREQYTPFIIGTWHYEKSLDKQRVFEQLTFNADGTLSGLRKWQARQVVSIDGQDQYTDWEDIPYENGTFTGTWSLQWERLQVGDGTSGMRNSSGLGENRIILSAGWDDKDNAVIAYNHNSLFAFADETVLRFAGYWQDADGWTNYERGEAEPSFVRPFFPSRVCGAVAGGSREDI
jgi:hypothetical protein